MPTHDHFFKKIRFRNIGIASKISMFFSMLLICLLVIIGSVFLYQQNVLIQNVIETRKNQYEAMIHKRKQHVYKSLEVSVQAYNRIIAQSVLVSLYDLDPITAEYMLKVFMEPQWVIGIIIYDEMNQIFTSIWRGKDSIEFFTGSFPYHSEINQYLLDVQDCIYKNQKIGQVKVIYTDAMVNKELELLKQEAQEQLSQDEKMSKEKLFDAAMTQVIISFLGALVMLGIALIIGRSLTKPILRVSSCIHEMGKNNLLASLPEKDLKRGDEIGVIARGYETSRINLSTIISTFRQNAINLANSSESLKLDSSSLFEFSEDMSGDADGVVKNAEENGNYVTAIAESTSQISINVNDTNEKIAQLSTNIDTVATSAGQASVNMSEITSNIEKISSDINTVNTSIETMSSNLATVSMNSSETVKISEAANKQINKSLDALTKLQKASDSIQSAVKIISSISTQTNLLALNATIEAVRGGGCRYSIWGCCRRS
jgi:methyl-accepting chemotaxis protein